ncbi:MAG: hypothetical protein IKP36_00935 [Bacteroidaceae bacterium]|nr:hypothetical protein [Bacteroidaceae bacterium]
MDIVITYVNGQDPEWQSDYVNCVGKRALTKRYRDWGTLPYLLRGIEECMPFVEKVFLVVARESQIPAWINHDIVHIVFHQDIIPPQCLPTFNSTAIEMFMHKIEGLSEEFIYFNDDFFPLMPCQPTDFFREGRAAASMKYHLFTFKNLFRVQTKRSDRFARKAAGVSSKFFYVRPQHTCAPMLRSVCAELYEKSGSTILATVTPVRTRRNCNQYVFTDYAFFTGRTFQQRISNKHISLSIATPQKLEESIVHPTRKLACINDVNMQEEKFQRLYACLHSAFQTRYPNKSRFEL